MNTATPDPAVLVVGAGPVGLTAAHELARRGVPVRLVDAAAGPAGTSRALATHARTLEVYDQLGVLDELLPRGRQVEHFTLHQNGRRLIRFDTDYSTLPTRFPFTLMVDQAITEEVLRGAAARHGVTVEWGVRLVAFTDRGDAVEAELAHADGRTERITVPWLVGTDGGHSTVRKGLGLQLIGDSSETWLIADAVVHCDLPGDSIHWMRTRAGTVMLVPFPEPGKWRLLDTADVSYPSDEEVAARFAAKITAGTGRPVTVESPSWVSVFTIQQRMIPRMRSGRCLLAGDAAHVHSPASGQGMNTGVQDAVNVAWKLAAVVRGEAAESLLDSYGEERVPVGAMLLKSTRMATLLVQLRSRAAATGLRAMFTVLRNVPPLKSKIQRKIMGGMSALDLSYGPPGEAGSRAAKVTGQRLARSPGWAELLAELRTPEWLLLVRGPHGYRADEFGAAVRVRTIGDDGPGALADPGGLLAEDLDLRPGGWLLVRPDGYLAARGGSDVDGPAPALRSWGVPVAGGERRGVPAAG